MNPRHFRDQEIPIKVSKSIVLGYKSMPYKGLRVYKENTGTDVERYVSIPLEDPQVILS